MIKKYRPDNGTDGDSFQAGWCCRCTKNDQRTERYCLILGLTMAYRVDDPDYPEEWCYDSDDNPVCTAFKKK